MLGEVVGVAGVEETVGVEIASVAGVADAVGVEV